MESARNFWTENNCAIPRLLPVSKDALDTAPKQQQECLRVDAELSPNQNPSVCRPQISNRFVSRKRAFVLWENEKIGAPSRSGVTFKVIAPTGRPRRSPPLTTIPQLPLQPTEQTVDHVDDILREQTHEGFKDRRENRVKHLASPLQSRNAARPATFRTLLDDGRGHPRHWAVDDNLAVQRLKLAAPAPSVAQVPPHRDRRPYPPRTPLKTSVSGQPAASRHIPAPRKAKTRLIDFIVILLVRVPHFVLARCAWQQARHLPVPPPQTTCGLPDIGVTR